MAGFVLNETAERELAGIHRYIAEDNLTAADKVVEDLYDLMALIALMPRMGRRRDDLELGARVMAGSRRIVNYLVYYFEGEEVVEVVRIFHGAQNTGRAFRS